MLQASFSRHNLSGPAFRKLAANWLAARSGKLPTKRLSGEASQTVVPGSEVYLTQPSIGNPVCPEHATLMVPHKFESWELTRPVEKGFRCANLTCGIVYIEGDDEGFYMLEPDGELAPYP